jgi:1-acyl-sn-glycerol-3-phosphate acyltransferase
MGWHGIENIPHNQPVLFCPTHSNSFLDGLFLCVYLDQPMFALARGDAFRNPKAKIILEKFKLLPIFRQSEGEADADVKNQQSFDTCHQLFKGNQYVLIFPEGVAKHQKEVLPMKKGAVLMMKRAWSEQIPVQVIPVGIAYNHFKAWDKKCDVTFGKPLLMSDFSNPASPNFSDEFNEKLLESMQAVYPSPFHFEKNKIHWGILGQILYYITWLFHFPFYFFCTALAKKLTKESPFYDSTILGLISVLFPIYYLLVWLLWYFCH